MEEFERFKAVAEANPSILNVEFFTFENFMRAHTQVITRCFGSITQETMLVPFADQANHHVTDNEVQFFNRRLTKKFLEADGDLEAIEC